MNLKKELETRWFLHQYTDEKVFELFEEWGKNFYFWVDLSADSMTIWNYVALMMAMRIMMRGNKAYLLVWGATSTIWNPSWKDKERPILSDEQLNHNQISIWNQFKTLCENVEKKSWKTLNFEIVNNKDFFVNMNVLDYLKEVWRYITVNRMLSKDIVKKRISDPDKRISYAEFSYMLIMWYDFYHLYTNNNVIMEVWWSDERDWILAWLELIQKKHWWTAYWITNKLIMDSTGKKFWKSEWNAIRLDPKKNNPYVCYHYFMNATDEDVERYLKLFTLLSIEDISNLIKAHNENPSRRFWQKELAFHVTEIIFWMEAAKTAEKIRVFLYEQENKKDFLASLDDTSLTDIHQALWNSIPVKKSTRILEILVISGLCESNSEAKKAIKNNAIYLNENKITDISYELSPQDWIQQKIILLRKWKKTYKTVICE